MFILAMVVMDGYLCQFHSKNTNMSLPSNIYRGFFKKSKYLKHKKVENS